ncbi:MAG: hypothetical protein VB025_09240 [Sphaerochaeta sp.]|nr:hypothetical protein [Sphaerochaeta sp.]
MTNSIGCVRVNSRSMRPMIPHIRHVELTDLNRRIAECIPYWPASIRIHEIAKRLHIPKKQIEIRMSTFQDRFLVFQDGANYSRLREDLSNMDEETNGPKEATAR